MRRRKGTRNLIALVISVVSVSAETDVLAETPRNSPGLSARHELVLVEPTGRLRSRRQQFWLYGVSLPRTKICQDTAGKAWGCGTNSFVEWSRIFSHGPVECVIKDTTLNTWACSIEGRDVATTLLRAGWGTRDPRINDEPLIDAEKFAKQTRHGIWSMSAS